MSDLNGQVNPEEMSEKSEITIKANVKELTKCSTCFEYMIGQNRRPIGFACGHVFCKMCSSELIKPAGMRKCAECPECRSITYTMGDLQPVYRLQAICEAIVNYHPPMKKVRTVSVKEVGGKITAEKVIKTQKVEGKISLIPRKGQDRNSGIRKQPKKPSKEDCIVKVNVPSSVFQRITRSGTEQTDNSTKLVESAASVNRKISKHDEKIRAEQSDSPSIKRNGLTFKVIQGPNGLRMLRRVERFVQSRTKEE